MKHRLAALVPPRPPFWERSASRQVRAQPGHSAGLREPASDPPQPHLERDPLSGPFAKLPERHAQFALTGKTLTEDDFALLMQKSCGYRNRERLKTDILFHSGGLNMDPLAAP